MMAIGKMIAQRIALGILTLFIISVIIFTAIELLPGNFAEQVLGQGATPETVAQLNAKYGYDKPGYVRYFIWLGNLLQGDLGVSPLDQRPVSEIIGTRFYNTLFLALYAAVMAVPLAIVLGVLAALYRNSLYDRLVNIITLGSISTPEFFGAYILMAWLAVSAGLFPSDTTAVDSTTSFTDKLYYLFIPALTLTLVTMAQMMRLTRAAIINLLASPYIEMAKLKGMSPARVIVKHALPNALAPIINVTALTLAYLVTGVLVVEVVFSYQGLGQLLIDNVKIRNGAIVQACCLIFAVIYIGLNLTADVLSILTNPRLLHRK